MCSVNFFLLPKTCNIALKFPKPKATIFLHELIFIPCFTGVIIGKMKHRKNIVKSEGVGEKYKGEDGHIREYRNQFTKCCVGFLRFLVQVAIQIMEMN